MTTKVYKPNSKKILRDIAVVVALMLGAILFGSPLALDRLPPILIGIGLLMGVYYFIMGVLPYIKITEANELEYRTDYGITRKIKLSDIKKITKGSGLGGYEHALFVYHSSDGQSRTNKIKSSYFNREDIVSLIAEIQGKVQVETNEELEDYLAGRKTKYSWKL